MDTQQKKKAAASGRQAGNRRPTAQGNRPQPSQQRRRPSGTPGRGTPAQQRAARERTSQERAAQERTSQERTSRERAERTRQQQRRRSAGVRPRRPHPVQPREVVYTPARPFNRNRLLLQLLSVAAVVVAMVFGISIFFKVENVTVSGAEKYSAWTVREASGIKEGDNLLTFGKAKASGKITTALPYVEDVRIGIKLPDTVHIEITELDVSYAIQAQDNTWWLITSGGRVIEQVDNATAGENTCITGVKLLSPTVQGQAVALETAQAQAAEPAAGTDTDTTGETQAVVQPVSVTAQERLETALRIVQALEENSVIGQIASVDVTDLTRLQMWYGDRYQVELGDGTNLSYKIGCMRKAIEQMDSYERGVLDASFTIWPDQVGYTPES